ncbi:acyl-CoA dehydrogenase family protein [Spirosoma utsteinense]|uniref:Alkylation response protein AidB-like acyl-CoA dehydrogenase n=1 Tax=Spirosoma utsteinense TaxID=2585773 RepID=A0ABR6WC44_9BACT|nr:acyl-CoA dehydrogenase family protein [Spirosoma utsteinense]MBC3787578.1 alkylation response protein AidB-like acyl-CoA dehydrogenase [Spirosoma utsteinense]MBC3794106.1 alkylation response protein AidB-like acyl-CoA dehydrogenase [Spirosoma utsteinense]
MNFFNSVSSPTLSPFSDDCLSLLDPLIERIADVASDTDSEGAFPEDAFTWLAEAGLLAITLPGHDLDFMEGQTARLLHLLKRIGSANLAVGRVYEGHINALYLIHLYATPSQRTAWYDDVIQHHRLFSVWNTQAGDGVSLVEQVSSTGDITYRLQGSKTFCSGAGWVQRPLITGELQTTDQQETHRKGWQMAVVPTERVSAIDQHDQFWRPLGMRASASFKLDFTGVELTDDDLLGHPGNYFQQPVFSGGAIRFAAVQLGGAEALYESTRQFLVQANRTDDVFQQTRLAEMAYLIESGNQWIRLAGDNTDRWLAEGADWQKIVAYANMTRTAIEEICLRIMPLAERCVGARGLLRPHPFERIHRDLTLYLRQPAPDATLVDIGKFVLTNTRAADELWH